MTGLDRDSALALLEDLQNDKDADQDLVLALVADLRDAGVLPPLPPPPPKATTRNPYLDMKGVAALLGELRGRDIAEATVRRYKSRGMLPVPDIQEGGFEYEPDEPIPVYGRAGGRRYRLPADPARPWTQPERKRAASLWRRSTIVTWNASRKGQGRWGARNPVGGDGRRVVPRYRRKEVIPQP